MHCSYCDRPATQRIPAVLGDACLMHTIEFWKGYLSYAKANPFVAAAEPVTVVPALVSGVPGAAH